MKLWKSKKNQNNNNNGSTNGHSNNNGNGGGGGSSSSTSCVPGKSSNLAKANECNKLDSSATSSSTGNRIQYLSVRSIKWMEFIRRMMIIMNYYSFRSPFQWLMCHVRCAQSSSSALHVHCFIFRSPRIMNATVSPIQFDAVHLSINHFSMFPDIVAVRGEGANAS